MANNPSTRSERAQVRAAAQARRASRAAMRENSFELLASGYSLQRIANARNVSVATIRREIDQAIAARRLDAPESYVHLQVARLSKALCLVDASLETGNLKAIGPFLKIVAELGRYHQLAAPERPIADERRAIPAPWPAPLALTHAAAPIDLAPAIARDVAEKGA